MTDSDSDRLKKFLHAKIAKRRKQIHPAHSPRFNHDMQLEINCIEWALHKIEVNKLPNDRLESVIKTMIKDLEKRKDKAMIRSDTDDLWTAAEKLYNKLTKEWTEQIITEYSIKNSSSKLFKPDRELRQQLHHKPTIWPSLPTATSNNQAYLCKREKRIFVKTEF